MTKAAPKPLAAPGMLMIGATGRKLGKTELATAALKRFGRTPLVGIKVTPVDPDRPCPSDGAGCGVCSSLEGPYELGVETEAGDDKDTERLLAAGAERVLWLRAHRAALPLAAGALLEALGPDTPCVCESASLRQVVAPDVFLLVTGPEPWKESARAARPHADRLVSRAAGPVAGVLDQVRFSHGRFSMPVEAASIVMAGGRSERMGQDKALLQVDGQPLVASLAAQLAPWLEAVVISADEAERFAFTGLPVAVDRAPDQGPLMGIASGLEASPCERNLVVACDMPLVDRALARELLARLDDADVVVPVDPQGRYEPLFAAYRKAAAPVMFAALAAGKRRIWDTYQDLRVERVPLAEYDLPINLNTPADLEAFLGGR